ncbi:MAG: flavin-containing monooxygenase [Acidimicrobiales bacterium]
MSDTMSSEAVLSGTAIDAGHVDVLIVGAGVSGIGAAYHLLEQCPGKTFTILETQETFGGTWWTHKYPGIRSDSDLFTFGYRFKPWTGVPIATAEEILRYLGEVIEDNDLARHIRYRHQVLSASWSSSDARWTVEALRTDTGERFRFTTGFLWMCQGYYRHATPYTPQWPGMDRFEGRIVHPQTWPDDLDLTGKTVVVIGSGATAATLVPAIAGSCAHVTMLQRSPTYFITGRNANDLADTLRELEVPEEWIHEIVRRRILKDQRAFTERCFTEPEAVKAELMAGVRMFLGEDYDVEQHFEPRYLPWRQRIAFIPDGDLFQGIAAGRASVVTDEIESFTEKGIRLRSGDELIADVIVTATGFDMSVMGDARFRVDEQPVDFAGTVGYHGTMFTGVPNLAWVFGYFRASWTLRVDLISDFVCRLLHHLDDLGARSVTPTLRPEEQDMPLSPWVDPGNFNPGYVMRSIHLLPRQGDHAPWQHTQDYWSERNEYPVIDLDDGTLVYR